ncbi:helix-turn-helix domain-containing protein [uncultured Flavonifractor sp.]|uniref:Helix-turn-helix domain-containing protein n=1 Tax=Candidatus Flavonifractor intestinigallinarum TaxID=2838586 RepID=A0A9D2MP29_9FIRM|nr:helix-turn-helix transcriptional regulator [uncultured Flavonifractor sp.]HJB80678.1 helix-turn-helix domain-containing protein [Candidatus Flavonifractor intestinigallinarum]
MVTMAQRIEALRNEAGLSRPALSAALGFPKNAIEKYETGRATPTKDQQEKMAAYFGVSLFYLRGESGDRTRQEDWMSGGLSAAEEEPVYRPAPVKRPKAEPVSTGGATMLDALFSTKQAKDQFKAMVLEVLRSPEGQEVIAQAVWKELAKRR